MQCRGSNPFRYDATGLDDKDKPPWQRSLVSRCLELHLFQQRCQQKAARPQREALQNVTSCLSHGSIPPDAFVVMLPGLFAIEKRIGRQQRNDQCVEASATIQIRLICRNERL